MNFNKKFKISNHNFDLLNIRKINNYNKNYSS